MYLQIWESIYFRILEKKVPMAFRLLSSSSNTLVLVPIFLILFCFLHICCATEFEAGGNRGWIVPPPPPPLSPAPSTGGANATTASPEDYYIHWASQMRFKVGDSLRFKYKKDSVMEVTESDYKDCNATQPISYSNTGNTVISLHRSGYFYFISGAAGHCVKGQKLVVRVMAPDHDASSTSSSSAPADAAGSPLPLLVVLLAALFIFFICLAPDRSVSPSSY